MSQLRQTTLETLAFVKYLYGLAQEEGAKPEPFCVAGLLTLHDAVELFLVVAREQPGANLKQSRPNFMDYWDMTFSNGGTLTQAASMKKLNTLRVDLKHMGVGLPKKEIANLVALVGIFFEENTPTAFGMDFSDISLLALVHDKRALQHLELAEAAEKSGDTEDAYGELATAFAILMDHYNDSEQVKLVHGGHVWSSRVSLESGFNLHASLSGAPRGNVELARGIIGSVSDYLDDMQRQITEIETATSILALGINYADYLRFQSNTPRAVHYISTDLEDGRGYKVFNRQGYTPDPEQYQRRLNFVVELAIAIERLLSQ